jgi:hypothetical protein
MSDHIRLDLELAADAEIDRQIQEPTQIFASGGFVNGVQAVAYKNYVDQTTRRFRAAYSKRAVLRADLPLNQRKPRKERATSVSTTSSSCVEST